MNERFPEMDCVAHGFIAHTFPLQDGTGYDPSIREYQVLQIALELEKLLSGTGPAVSRSWRSVSPNLDWYAAIALEPYLLY